MPHSKKPSGEPKALAGEGNSATIRTSTAARSPSRMVTVEAALIAIVGIVLGAVASTATLMPFSIVVSGTPFPSGPLWIYVVIVGAALLVALAATLMPAWAAMRSRPTEAVIAAG